METVFLLSFNEIVSTGLHGSWTCPAWFQQLKPLAVIQLATYRGRSYLLNNVELYKKSFRGAEREWKRVTILPNEKSFLIRGFDIELLK